MTSKILKEIYIGAYDLYKAGVIDYQQLFHYKKLYENSVRFKKKKPKLTTENPEERN